MVRGNAEWLHTKTIELMCIGKYGSANVSLANDCGKARQRYIETGWFW
jgi:hypothetical protein